MTSFSERINWRAAMVFLLAATGFAVLAPYVVNVLVLRELKSYQATGLGGAPSKPAASPLGRVYSIVGVLRLRPDQYVANGLTCSGTAPAHPGARVVVADEAGAQLTYAVLSSGAIRSGVCELPFTLRVPAGKGTYAIDVPAWGQETTTEAELSQITSLTYG